MMAWAAWQREGYQNLPQELLDFYHSFQQTYMATNENDDWAYLGGYRKIQTPAMAYTDLAYVQETDSPHAYPWPSFTKNDPAYLPEYSVTFLRLADFARHSLVLDTYLGYYPVSPRSIKPPRSYWTGKPARRRNLPAG